MIDLSMAESLILTVALKSFMEQEMSQKDKEIAQLLMYKLKLNYKGKKARIVFEE